jgi:hypothetical protein
LVDNIPLIGVKSGESEVFLQIKTGEMDQNRFKEVEGTNGEA